MLLRIQNIATGKFFVLSTDAALTIELHTTAFNNQDDFLGSFSYPGDMPLEDNRANIQNAQHVATDARLRTLNVMMWLGYLPYKQCRLSFTIEHPKIVYNLFIDSTLINNQINGVKLWQMYGGQGNTDTGGSLQAYMTASVIAAPGAMPAVFFPFKDDGAYKAVDGAPAAMIFNGNWDANANSPQLHNSGGSGLKPSNALLGWVYKVTNGGSPDLGGGSLQYNAGTYMVYDGTVWYNTINPYGVRVAGITTDLVFPAEAIINRWEMDAAGNSSFKMDPPGGPYCQTQVPFFYLVFVIRQIFAFLGITSIVGKWMNETAANRVVIWSRVSAPKGNVLPGWTYFMPDISIPDFLKELRLAFGLMIDIDLTRNIAIVESLANLETTSQVIDLRANQVLSFRETTDTTTYYLVTQPIDSDDKSYPDSFTPVPLQIGTQDEAVTETDISLNSVSTQMVTMQAASDAQVASPVLANWRIPYIKQALYGQTPMDQINTVDYADTNNFKLRFLYYHGMQPNTQGFLYPYGSSDNQDVNGMALTSFNLSMSPGAQDFSALQAYYSFLVNSKPFELGVELNIQQLLSLKANTRILVKDPYNFSTVTAILDQVAADLTQDNKLIQAKVTMYPIVLPNNAQQPAATFVPGTVPPPFNNGVVYAKLVKDNQQTIYETRPTNATTYTANLTVYFYADAAGKVPKSVTRLSVGLSTAQTSNQGNSTITNTAQSNQVCSGTSQLLQANAPLNQNMTDGSGDSYVWIYTLIANANYNVIS